MSILHLDLVVLFYLVAQDSASNDLFHSNSAFSDLSPLLSVDSPKAQCRDDVSELK